MKYAPKSPTEVIDAVQLSYDMHIIIPSSEYFDGGKSHGSKGEWLITHPQGGQYFLSDFMFKAKYERID